jgi:hypothetical protein
LFESHGPQPQPSLWQRITAFLVFDSLAQPVPVGIRKTDQAARQILYRAGQWDVDLSFEPGDAPETINVTGQVIRQQNTPQNVAGISVYLLQDEQILASTTADSIGEFTFDHIVNGTYDLKIHTGDEQLWIEQMDVQLNS